MSLRQSSFFLRFLTLGALAHVYVGARLIPDLLLGGEGTAAAILALVLSCVLIPLGMLARSSVHPPWGDRIAWVGLLAMGLFSSLFVLTALRDALLLAVWLANLAIGAALPWTMLRNVSAWAVAGLSLAGSLAGFYNARRLARVVDVDVPIAGLPKDLDGFTIVQISDIHVGPTIKKRYVQAIVDAVNEQLPDMVAITGDVVDGSVEQLAAQASPLGQLRAPYGVYLVTGNHEYYSGAAPWVAEFRRMGLRVLMNEHALIHPSGLPMVVAGVTDYSAGSFDPQQRSNPKAALSGAPADAFPRILLAHQPRSAAAAEPLGYTLQLSGHTHGGQFFPWGFFVRFQQPFTAGLHRLGRMWVYTSRGTGYWGPPKRLWAPSEITRLRLRAAPAR
ncbi:metallophosphoesterase [Achromobacter arsenitoxydans]|uniref:Calcineurin-like phosphoesterase family protein 6 n=1 Tax=Achromobacter arsenitoxydans SY8 TaxID=477184 RepID=H0FBE2_9BURK|nr:metallophosphoesterase [Achromobacter arsenitoxydans]EHK64407.1 calcineurin-like phosphoesterase family protein 6 [Achromobacter arsenitoxydans SY8]